ncbi:hypothetical protein QBC36DRAFT_315566 [Triangularia setosa]|uniref:Uncharacterized protein n=1 Tax=Triangularia setosa TaxID=2587417 RepID=A0AAN7A359_9PEZI|nr:hypothetical protein QBC36DRAFT_315566 [Podospora setosa]
MPGLRQGFRVNIDFGCVSLEVFFGVNRDHLPKNCFFVEIPVAHHGTGMRCDYHCEVQARAQEEGRPNQWTIPSYSANTAAEYKTFLTDEKQDPFVFALIGDEEEEEEANKNNKNDDDAAKPKCDDDKKCYCTQLYNSHPEYPYVMMRVAKSISEIRTTSGCIRLTITSGYDFEEADGWQEKWAVCEALGCFLKDDSYYMLASRCVPRVAKGLWQSTADNNDSIDDGDGADATWRLMGRMFLSMLTQFEQDGLLTKDGPVKNLGFIMAVWMSIPSNTRAYSLLVDSMLEPLGSMKDKNMKRSWPHSFDRQILTHARKHVITLKGLHNLDELIKGIECEGEADLPKPKDNTEKAIFFHYKRKLTRYKQRYKGVPHFMSIHVRKKKTTLKSLLGSDNLDLTAWTSAERKTAA